MFYRTVERLMIVSTYLETSTNRPDILVLSSLSHVSKGLIQNRAFLPKMVFVVVVVVIELASLG